MCIMDFGLDEIEESEQADILRLLSAPKFESRQQFLIVIPEYLIKHLLKIRQIALLNSPEINYSNPTNLKSLIYGSLLPYEDPIFYKHQILQNIVKNTNLKIMELLDSKKKAINVIKKREIQILNHQIETSIKKQTTKFTQKKNCPQCLCKIRGFKANEEQIKTAQTLRCKGCKEYYHSCCIQKQQQDKQINFMCPACQLSFASPLEKVISVLHEPEIINLVDENKEKTLLFECPNSESNYQIQMRCLQIGNVDKLTWPESGEIYLNNLKVIQFDSKMGQKSGESYIVTQSVKFGSTNKITILYQQSIFKQLMSLNISQKQQTETQNYYLFAVYSVKVFSPRDWLYDLQKDQSVSIQESSNRISTFINQIGETTLKVSLLDIQTLNLMKIPGRGFRCTHIQCFDLEIFVKLNQIENKWICPICQQKCHKLVIDQFQKAIIENIVEQQLKKTEIEFDRDGKLTEQLIEYNQKSSNLDDEMQIEL
ncbi:unnamed protein product (macronuclear) [Paramecium tetraurelia]|uniref:SP-RING-type domain-containing protein n=1 Tax=Paramecium tetraurelia TaxID=5888 RepID=A0DUV1_PARTE|nr:uncharacterized protein GSPATT00020480001 [Paramecium tetraurelia]CAK86818.1 unnamed protein product [Paramecium tetraurelia]|eukprot:XP_001454215.1 hypothetical protein (macronuclear) [Paramecium tetraurelia strain d4-2]